MRPGRLKERVAFQRRSAGTDEFGNTDVGDWETQFERPAQFLMRPGSETYQAARLQGVQPLRVVVRLDPETGSVTPEWRLVDLRQNRVLEITAAADMDRRGMWWTMECTAGGAA